LGFDDKAIRQAGYEPFAHRDFLKRYYTGTYPGSPARGALFSSNPRTGDARISGSLASLCGLESALESGMEEAVEIAIQKILLMQAHSFFLGGLPMLYYGDEVGYINDYSYRDDPNRNYDNRWMHRPLIDWEKNRRVDVANSIEQKIYHSMARLATIRRSIPMLADYSNIQWLSGTSQHVAAYCRRLQGKTFYGLFNFRAAPELPDRNLLIQQGTKSGRFYDHWAEREWTAESDWLLPAYGFALLTDIEE
jgi:amylosucrase